MSYNILFTNINEAEKILVTTGSILAIIAFVMKFCK